MTGETRGHAGYDCAHMIRNLIACAAATVLALGTMASAQPQQEGKPMWVYISGPSGPKSKGIYVSQFDEATGHLTQPTLAAEVKRASYFWIHPNGKYLYSVDQ